MYRVRSSVSCIASVIAAVAAIGLIALVVATIVSGNAPALFTNGTAVSHGLAYTAVQCLLICGIVVTSLVVYVALVVIACTADSESAEIDSCYVTERDFALTL